MSQTSNEALRDGPCNCDETYGTFTRGVKHYAQCRKCGGFWVIDEVRGMYRRFGGDHEDHPPVEGGYRGALAEHDTGAAQGAYNAGVAAAALKRSVTPVPSGVIGEAVLAAASRVDTPKSMLRLPDDSAERKRIPLATGLLDYFPAAIANAINLLDSGETWDCDNNAILQYLAERDYPVLLAACLDALQDELCGPPTQCRGRDVVKRWGAALIAVAEVSVYGNEKHNPGEPLHHARGKSMDHADCIARHTWDAGGFDGPMRHSACRAWRAGALGQEAAEADGAPLARGARLPESSK